VEKYRTSVGLDVHARSVVACGLDRSTGEVFERRLTPDHREILEWIGSLPSPAVVTYEAGPTGFGLARALGSAGSSVWWPHRRSCSARLGIGSRPMPVTLGI
jgi:transposase